MPEKQKLGTVAELIAALQAFPPGTLVLSGDFYSSDFLFRPFASVQAVDVCPRPDGTYCKFAAPRLVKQNQTPAVVLR